MRRGEEYLKESNNERERQKVLNNFYTKKIKNGKTIRADYLDKAFLSVIGSVILIYFLNKLISNLIISLLISITIITIIIKYSIKWSRKKRLMKIEDIKQEFKLKLQEEKIISEDEDIEDYIIDRYYEKKLEIKKNVSVYGNDKILKLYFLFAVFYLGSFFVKYSIYYIIIAIISFITATLIASYKLTEYIRKRNF